MKISEIRVRIVGREDMLHLYSLYGLEIRMTKKETIYYDQNLTDSSSDRLSSTLIERFLLFSEVILFR